MKRATAIFGLIAVVIGVPAILLALSGSPRLPSIEGVSLSDRYLPSELLLEVLAFIAWLAWCYVAVVVVLRTLFHLAFGSSSTSPLGALTAAAAPSPLRRLVDFALGGAIVAATISASSTATKFAAPPSAISAAQVPERSAEPERHEIKRDAYRQYVVKPGDSLWRIAEQELGSGFRWREIYDLNRGRTFADGDRLEHPRLIQRGWTLRLPARTGHVEHDATSRRASSERKTPAAVATHSVADRAAPEPTSTAPGPTSELVDGERQPATPPPVLQFPSGVAVALSFASGLLTAELLGSLKRRRRYRPLEEATDEPDNNETVSDFRRTGAEPSSAHLLEAIDAVTTAWRVHTARWPRFLTAKETPHSVELTLAGDGSLPADLGGTISPRLRFAEQGDTVAVDVAAPFRGLIDREPAPLERGLMVPLGYAGDASVTHVSLLGTSGASIVGPAGAELAKALLLSIATVAAPDHLQVVLLGAPFSDLNDLPHVTHALEWPAAEPALRELKLELLRRARIVMESGSDDLHEHLHASPHDGFPAMLIVASAPPAALRGTVEALAQEASALGGAVIGLGWDVPGSLLHVSATQELAITCSVPIDSELHPFRLSEQTLEDVLRVIRDAWVDPEPDQPQVPAPSAVTEPSDLEPPIVLHEPEHRISTSDPPLQGNRLELSKPAPPSGVAAVECLGSLQLYSHDGRLVTKGWRSKSLEILCYLVAYPDGIAKDRVLEQFWPEAELSKAQHEFDRSLYHIRLSVRAGSDSRQFVTNVIDAFRLIPDEWWVDAWEMTRLIEEAGHSADPNVKLDRLRTAVSLYGGEFCDDRYFSWAGQVRDRFRNAFLRAASQLAELLVDAGDLRQASELFDLALERDPLCEELARQAIRLDASTGRRMAAGQRYDKLRATLAKELGVEPDPETHALMRQLEHPTLATVGAKGQ